MGKTHILGIPLDILTRAELERAIRHLLYRRHCQIVTPNPEFILLAQKNQEFFSVLEQATLSIPDGIGLKFAGWLKGVNLKRYSGSNLLSYLLRLSDQKHLRVAVINWRGGLSSDEDILQAVKQKYPHLKFFVFSIEKNGDGYQRERLRAFKPDIVFTALGAPEQDTFIRRRLLRDLPTLRIAMGVGGSFNFLTNKVRRAPRLIQFLGFEWLWRLLLQPLLVKKNGQSSAPAFPFSWRLKRIWNAVISFPFKVVAWEFRRFVYRANVAAFIVNKYGEVLMLNPIRSKQHYWSIPQGGVEKGESAETALRREIKEETGLEDIEIIGFFPRIFQFDWPKYYTHSGYKGQRQSLFIIRYNGKPQAVRTNRYEHRAYRWVKLDQLLSVVSKIRREQYEMFLQKYYDASGEKN
jgi:N-acetylglucosaminyldiphosphoundecaprenol N-acetyl-beta-D-mannosaminyltransferase